MNGSAEDARSRNDRDDEGAKAPHPPLPSNANGPSEFELHSRYAVYKERFGDVEGWFSDESAALFDFFLTHQTSRDITGDLLEIGVAYGKSALMMALHADAASTIRLVDPSDVAGVAAQRVRDMTANPVMNFKIRSEALAHEALPGRSTRMMHIDGDHGRWALHNDLDIAYRVMTADGLVVIDDFFSESFVGVTLGAIEWLALHPLAFEMILVGFNKAYLVRPRYAQQYLTAIRDDLPVHLRAAGLTDFSLWRTDVARALGCFGITARQFDRDVVTREFASGLPEELIDGRIRI